MLSTCPSPVLWAYTSATITEFNDAHCSGDFPISLTGCTWFHWFQHNNCGRGDISAITLLILSLSGYNPVNILWYTAPVDMMTFRSSHRSYQSICQQHLPCSHPQVTLIYYTTWLIMGEVILKEIENYLLYILRELEIYHIYPTPPLRQDMRQGQFFKQSLTGLNSEFSFS